MWPDLFVVGGGVSRKAHKFLPLLDLRTPIVPAVLENAAGIIGAALLATQTQDVARPPPLTGLGPEPASVARRGTPSAPAPARSWMRVLGDPSWPAWPR